MSESRVQVRAEKTPAGVTFLNVRLYSNIRKGIISYRPVEIDGRTEKNIAKEVAICGGALAEYQCENYGDAHDPDQCSRAAAEAFEEVWARLNEGAEAVGESTR